MTTKKLSLMLLTGTVVLSACQILPEFNKPAAPIPDKFPVAVEPTATPVADIGWSEFFLNPELRQTIAAALANNRDLKTAALRIEEARALYNIQRSDQQPTVNGTDANQPASQSFSPLWWEWSQLCRLLPLLRFGVAFEKEASLHSSPR